MCLEYTSTDNPTFSGEVGENGYAVVHNCAQQITQAQCRSHPLGSRMTPSRGGRMEGKHTWVLHGQSPESQK